ncbi:SctD/MshK family protein [Bradyrhizobium sp. UFLA05-112]
MHETNSPHFEVLSGLYCGVTGKTGMGPSLIGSGLDADLVFIEQGLEPHHVRVTPHRNSIEIEAFATEVGIEGRETISPNERVLVPLPTVMHLGEMSIRWSIEGTKQTASTGRWLATIALASVLISSVAVGAVSTSFSQSDEVVGLSADVGRGNEVATKPTPKAPYALMTDAAAEELQQEVERAGLFDIKVGSGAGVVTADGTVTPASLPKWQELQQRFDDHGNGAYVLINTVAVKQEKAPSSIAVEAVWRGSDPYLVIAGQKYFVGALLNNGWTVNGIEEGRVLLSRNGRLVALPY